MISSIFGKTKPINYIIILTFLFVFYWAVIFFLFSTTYNPDNLVEQFAGVTVLLFIIFIINFIVKRNKITSGHSFTILFFTLLIVIFPEVLLDNNSILCTFFLLLATRRLLSIKSLKQIKIKLFDASLWVVVSSLFYDWALLYLFLVFITIYLYDPKNIRNWLVPIIGALTVFIISFGVLTILNQQLYLENHYQFNIDITTHFLSEWRNSMKLLLYIFVTLTLVIVTFLKLSKSGLGRINTMRLVTIFFLIGLLITLLKSSIEITPILLTFFPAAVFMSNYIETIKKPNIKELILIASVIIPFIVLAVRFI
tara:strand:- start:753 stop:1685 length:933 start_codon:yes stop_codon:yes gene_type:complete